MNDNRSTQLYFSEMNKYELLTKEKEVSLAKRIEGGDEKAKKALVEANLRYVVSIVRKEFWKHSDIEADLIQGGNLGLMRAAEKFEVEKGFRFSTYATEWIRQGAFKVLIKTKPKTLTRAKTICVARLSKVCRECCIMDMYNEKSMTKIIQEFNSRYPKEGGEGYTKDDIRRMQDDYKTSYFVSLDQPLHDDEEFAMIDTIANINTRNPQSIAGDMSAHKKIGEFICQLNEDEEFVMVKLFGLDGKGANTYKEIGAQLNLLVRDVKKIESSALKSLLRTMFSSRILEEI